MARLRAPLPNLTDRQIEILRYIFDYYVQYLSYPTKAQVGRHFEASSRNITGMVRPLFKKGDLRPLPGRGQYEISNQGIERLQALGTKIPAEMIESEEQSELSIAS